MSSRAKQMDALKLRTKVTQILLDSFGQRPGVQTTNAVKRSCVYTAFCRRRCHIARIPGPSHLIKVISAVLHCYKTNSNEGTEKIRSSTGKENGNDVINMHAACVSRISVTQTKRDVRSDRVAWNKSAGG